MLRYMIPIVLAIIAKGNLAQDETKWFEADQSAASESQLKFAIENNYDGTGPGAKGREYAYNTYKTLDDALIAYLDDPDTKLPEHERERAIRKLLNSQSATDYSQDAQRFYPITVEEYTANQKTPPSQYKYSFPKNTASLYLQESPRVFAYERNDVSFGRADKSPAETVRFHTIRPTKGNPVSLAQYTKVDSSTHQLSSPRTFPFSYGIHGGSKPAQEAREGGTVHGYYSFVEADGKQRVVQYTNDDKLGYRATVHRTGH